MQAPPAPCKAQNPASQSSGPWSNFQAVDRKCVGLKKKETKQKKNNSCGATGATRCWKIMRWQQAWCFALIHHGAVLGVRRRVDGLQLVQHFTDNDDTRPHGANAGSQWSILAVGQSKCPRSQKDEIEQRYLKKKKKKHSEKKKVVFS